MIIDQPRYILNEIETAANEIAELLTLPQCQKPQVLTEVEIILEKIRKLREVLTDV